LAYSLIFDEGTHIVSGIDAIGLGFNGGGYRAHGDKEENDCCGDLHGGGLVVMMLQWGQKLGKSV
jgi:hypothetical protein